MINNMENIDGATNLFMWVVYSVLVLLILESVDSSFVKVVSF